MAVRYVLMVQGSYPPVFLVSSMSPMDDGLLMTANIEHAAFFRDMGAAQDVATCVMQARGMKLVPAVAA